MIKNNVVDWKALAEALLLLTLAVMLWACVPADDKMAEGGIGGTGINSGPISGFGSIIVNGVHFDVSDAEILVADMAATEDDLQPGMIVTVYGDMDANGETGSASRVVFAFDLIATIDDISVDRLTFTAQGQKVRLDELTVIDGRLLADLAVDDWVYVSGLKDDSGALLARYIGATGIESNVNLAGDDSVALSESVDEAVFLEVELTGNINALNRWGQHFMLSGQVVDYSQALFPDASMDVLQDGVLIWLKGRLESGVIVASQIKSVPVLDVVGRDVLLDGLVAVVNSPGQFELQGVLVSFDEATRFIDGGVSELVAGAALVVQGQANESGVLASELRFKSLGIIQRESVVLSISGGQITLVDVGVTVVATTLMLDNSSLALRRFSVADIRSGDMLKIFGYQSNEELVLTRLERLDSLAQ